MQDQNASNKTTLKTSADMLRCEVRELRLTGSAVPRVLRRLYRRLLDVADGLASFVQRNA